MKSLTRRILVSLVLSAVTLFTAPTLYASCMFSVTGDLGDGFCSCGSSAGPYCVLGGTDVTADLGSGFMGALCAYMCPGVPLQSKNINDPSRPLLLEYPRSHQLAQANLMEVRRLKSGAGASPFCGNVTIYDLVLP